MMLHVISKIISATGVFLFAEMRFPVKKGPNFFYPCLRWRSAVLTLAAWSSSWGAVCSKNGRDEWNYSSDAVAPLMTWTNGLLHVLTCWGSMITFAPKRPRISDAFAMVSEVAPETAEKRCRCVDGPRRVLLEALGWLQRCLWTSKDPSPKPWKKMRDIHGWSWWVDGDGGAMQMEILKEFFFVVLWFFKALDLEDSR